MRFIAEKQLGKNEKGIFISYFYLHGELENTSGFDLVRINIEDVYKLLNASDGFECTVEIWGKTYDALLYSRYDRSLKRMTGLIVDKNDANGILDAIHITKTLSQ